MSQRTAKRFGLLAAGVVCATVMGITPVAAQGDECRGGGPAYWATAVWPNPFEVPKAYRQPSGKRAVVRPATKFDLVFRYRNARDSEGPIFPGKSLRQVLGMQGDAKKSLARQAIAALLNAAEPDNAFLSSKSSVIRDFQVFWDGTDDMSKAQARKFMAANMSDRNEAACPDPA